MELELFEKQLKEALEQDIASGKDKYDIYNKYANETGLDDRDANVQSLKDLKTWKILIDHGINPRVKKQDRSAWLQNLRDKYIGLPKEHKEAAFDLLDAMFDPNKEDQSKLPFERGKDHLVMLREMYDADKREAKRLPVSQVKPSRSLKLAQNIARGWVNNGDITTHFDKNGKLLGKFDLGTEKFARDVYDFVMSSRSMRSKLRMKQKIEADPTRSDKASNIKALHKENLKDAHDYWHKIKGGNQGM